MTGWDVSGSIQIFVSCLVSLDGLILTKTERHGNHSGSWRVPVCPMVVDVNLEIRRLIHRSLDPPLWDPAVSASISLKMMDCTSKQISSHHQFK